MSLTLKKLQKFAWKKDGALPQGYTSHYSEMPGAPRDYANDQHERAMKASINKPLDEKLREKGLI
jgi:hypothetical protein